MRKMKIWIIGLLLLCTLQGAALHAASNPIFEKDHDCTITVDAKTSKLAGERESLAIYKVADVDSMSNSLVFSWLDELGKVDVGMDTFVNGSAKEKEEAISLLEKRVSGLAPLEVKKFDKTGKLEYTVKPGMYLMVQMNPVKATVQTTFAVVPVMNENGDGWVYEAKTEPKYSLSEEPPATGDEELRGQMMLYGGIGLVCILCAVAGIVVLKKRP